MAQQPRLPPTVEYARLVGSGAQNRPCSPATRCTSPFSVPASHSSRRSPGEIRSTRFIRSSDNTMPPAIGTVAPVVLVPRPRTTRGSENSLQSCTTETTSSCASATTTACGRSEEHTSELQSLTRISYAVFCLTKNKISYHHITHQN